MLALQSIPDVSGLSLSEDWVPAFTFFTTLSISTSDESTDRKVAGKARLCSLSFFAASHGLL